MSGGSVIDQHVSAFEAHTGATVNVSGGTIPSLLASSGATANWSGGSIERLWANAGASVQVFGQDFLLDGTPIVGLEDLGDSLVLAVRGGSLLTGYLADGAQFEITLQDTLFDTDYFSASATLRLTIVPEPTCLVLGAMALGILALRNTRRSTASCGGIK